MSNKHQARKVREKSIKAIKRTTISEDRTPIDLIDGPDIVRVTQAMYQNLPADGSNFYRRMLVEQYINAPSTTVAFDIEEVPNGMVLDISQVRYRFLVALAGVGLQALPDFATSVFLVWRMKVSGLSPWDQRVGGTLGLGTGTVTLNQNIMDQWGDTPVHLIAKPGQTVSYEIEQTALPVVISANQFSCVEISGRWIPASLWDDISFKNRVS
jgi:hypothetical protein